MRLDYESLLQKDIVQFEVQLRNQQEESQLALRRCEERLSGANLSAQEARQQLESTQERLARLAAELESKDAQLINTAARLESH